MRKPFVAGNWKMNMNSTSSVELVNALAAATEGVAGAKVDVAVIPPFVYLPTVIAAAKNTRIAVGAQNMYFEESGAFTGEIAPNMLKEIGCTYVAIGHSERRHVFGETDEMVNKKVHAAITAGLLPILCVGELLEEREANKTAEVVLGQVKAGLAGLGEDKVRAVTLAYEPVWAIGTGKTASPEQAEEVHAMIRKLLAELYSEEIAQELRIQYGGSAKADNAAELLGQTNIDGLLVGGASLKADSFAAIIKAGV